MRIVGRRTFALGLGIVLAGWVGPVTAADADTRVCVEVVTQDTAQSQPATARATDVASTSTAAAEQDGAGESTADAEAPRPPERLAAYGRSGGTLLPVGHDPLLYLKRLIEYFVTHEDGFVAVSADCSETIRLELYPLRRGWTAFARYTGHGREERVDRLYVTEFTAFAERAVLALLHDQPISTTIKRDNVLRADSLRSRQTIKGTSHFVLNLGTRPRGGQLATAVEAGTDDQGVQQYDLDKSIRLLWPMNLSLGYLGKFESWGIEALAQLDIGTSKAAAKKTPDSGGHVDYGGDAGLALHFLYYLDPRGLSSLYLGAGSTFELIWFSAVKPRSARGDESRSTIVGGGLNVDLLLGYEFMRASAAQFRLQAGIHLPAYMIQNEDKHGSIIATWFPAVSVGLGVMF